VRLRPSVAAPGHTNFSDATVSKLYDNSKFMNVTSMEHILLSLFPLPSLSVSLNYKVVTTAQLNICVTRFSFNPIVTRALHLSLLFFEEPLHPLVFLCITLSPEFTF